MSVAQRGAQQGSGLPAVRLVKGPKIPICVRSRVSSLELPVHALAGTPDARGLAGQVRVDAEGDGRLAWPGWRATNARSACAIRSEALVARGRITPGGLASDARPSL
jgi:hypothetical protein